MTAHADMVAAGVRVLDLLTASEAAVEVGRPVKAVHRLADEGVLDREWFGTLARFTPESVAAYQQRTAS